MMIVEGDNRTYTVAIDSAYEYAAKRRTYTGKGLKSMNEAQKHLCSARRRREHKGYEIEVDAIGRAAVLALPEYDVPVEFRVERTSPTDMDAYSRCLRRIFNSGPFADPRFCD